MALTAALIYWVIVVAWLAVLAAVIAAYFRNGEAFGAMRLLLIVVAIDTCRNIIENLYFGMYFGSKYGLFDSAIGDVLGLPYLLIVPKVINVIAACGVLFLLLWKWMPAALRERIDARKNLHEAESRFHLLIGGAKEYAIYLVDLHGNITSWNPAAERVTGYSAAEAIGMNVANFKTPAQRESGSQQRAFEIARKDGHYEIEAERTRKDGTSFWAHLIVDAIRDSKGEIVGYAAVIKDITEAKFAQERLTYLAHFDQLTGLPNRTSLADDLREVTRGGPAPHGMISVAIFDLDGFKDINDTMGHAIGDSLLRAVADRMRQVAGPDHTVYRLGGDEFVLLVRGTGDPLTVSGMVDEILKRLEMRFDIDDQALFVGASAGLVIARADETDADELLSNADLALYDAKALGGRRCSFFVPTMRAKALSRQAIDIDLRRACVEGEFVLHYQPQVRMRDGAITGAEVLLRWNHPKRGMLPAGVFIDALTKSPAAVEVGHWILNSACRTAAEWRQKGLAPIRIGINLFPRQFQEGLLCAEVKTALAESGLPADALELEITENIALGHDEVVLASLRRLREAGVGLAFDDFGTGYASLSYLTRYPLTRLKIDRSFVQKAVRGSKLEDSAIVRSMIVMGHNLGLDVIAEGVETPEQAAYLYARRCDEVQGYLYSKPLPKDEFEALLRSQRRFEVPPVARAGRKVG